MGKYATLDYTEGPIKTFKAVRSAQMCGTKPKTEKPCKITQSILELLVNSWMRTGLRGAMEKEQFV